MQYSDIHKAVFLERPNRFIAHCTVDGMLETVHVKNTGRCRELLVPGATVYLEKSSNPNRKTAYDLVTVETPFGLVNMDAAAPNQVAGELLRAGAILSSPTLVQPEVRFGASRLDFYAENDRQRLFVEVKGVTLRQGEWAVFPDAPTVRGAKHMGELVQAVAQGYRAMALLIVQMGGCTAFRPNRETDPAFCRALRDARDAGVEVRAVDCRVTPNTVTANRELPVDLDGHKNC
jgi:sugar fermentation stimulation protein A